MAAHTYDLTELLHDQLQMRLDPQLNAIRFANREFEGTLKQRGDTVTVEALGLLTWGTRADHNTDIAATTFTTTSYDIQVAQEKVLRVPIASIDELRIAFDAPSSILDNMATGLAVTQETHFLAQLATDAGNTVATAALSATTIVAKIEAMNQALNEDNAPQDRVLFVTPAVVTALRTSGYMIYTAEGYARLKSGVAENIAGFDVYMSTVLPTNTIIGFCKGVPNFINQYSEIEAKDNPYGHGINMVGESYYQAKTVGPVVNCIVKHVYS